MSPNLRVPIKAKEEFYLSELVGGFACNYTRLNL